MCLSLFHAWEKRPCKCKADFFYVWNNLLMQMYFQTLPQAHLRLTSFILFRLSGDSSTFESPDSKREIEKNTSTTILRKRNGQLINDSSGNLVLFSPSENVFWLCVGTETNTLRLISSPCFFRWRQQNMTYNVTYLTCEPMKPRVISVSSTDFVLYTMSRLLFHGREALAYVSLSSRPIFY